MKKLKLLLCFFCGMLLTGCASYQAISLSALDPKCIRTYSELEEVFVGCKVYSAQDCYDYLDRDLLKKNIQPIQFTFENKGNKHYLFSIDHVSLPCMDPQNIAKSVHTSTLGRVVGYSLGGIFLWPLFIPAIIDGIKSSAANSALDQDFDHKAKEYISISPGEFTKTLIFVPKNQFQPLFNVTLIEEESGFEKTLEVLAVP